MKKAICTAISFVLLLSIFSGCSPKLSEPPELKSQFSDCAYVSYEGEFIPSAAPIDMELVSQKGYSALFYNPTTAAFAVNDMRTGEFYYSIPDGADTSSENSHLLVTDVDQTDDTVKTKYSVDAKISTQKTKDGFMAWYIFTEERYAIPVEYMLCEDGFRVRLHCDKIIEEGDYRVFTVSILPFLYAQQDSKDGFILVPDGSGAIMRFDADKSNMTPYSGMLYGNAYLETDDYIASVKQNCLLPFLGIQGKTGGVLAYAENGSAFASVFAAAKEQDSAYNHAYFKFDLRKQQDAIIGNPESYNAKSVVISEEGKIDLNDVSVRYFMLDSTSDNGLSKMAETARNIMEDEVGDISSASENALYITTLGGYAKSLSILGFRTLATVPVADFQSVASMMNNLKKSGVDKTTLIYSGYNHTAMRGGITGQLEPDKSIGSVNELEKLANNLGTGRLLITYDPVSFQKNGNGVSKNTSAIRDISLTTVKVYDYKRNTFQLDKSTEGFLLKTNIATDFLHQAQEWLEKNVSSANLLITGFSDKLYGDYSENGYNRQQTLCNVRETLMKMSTKVPVSTMAANYDAAKYSTVIVNAPSASSGYDTLDESVPFYQMVFSGKRNVVSCPINTAGDSEREFLNCVSFGMVPHYELIPQALEMPGADKLDSFYSAAYDLWEDEIVHRYKQYAPVYATIHGRSMVNYRVVSEGLRKLTYEGGVTVWVNMSDKVAEVEGQSIDPGQICVVDKGE